MASKFLKHLGFKKGPPHPPKPDYGAQKSTSVQELLPKSPTRDRSTLSLASTPSHTTDFDTASLPDPHHNRGFLTQERDHKFGGARPKDTGKNTSPKGKCHTLPHSTDNNLSRQSYSITDSAPEADEKSPPNGESGDAKEGASATPPQLLDEYSDPFDLKKELAETPELLGACAQGPVAEDDYSVPYEVKKVNNKAELKMREGDVPHSPHRGDSCIEGAEGGYSPSRLQYSTESKDQRPPEEYDAPWEWSMNQNILQHIETANGSQSQTPLMTPKRTISAPSSSQSQGATGSDGQESSEKLSSESEHVVLSEDKKRDEDDEDDEGYTHLDLEQASGGVKTSPGLDARPKDRTGNYEKPWDLTTTRNELEERLKAVSMLEKSKSTPAVSSSGPSPPHEADTRPAEGYDKPWDWKPHKKDDRPPEGYEKPWDWRPHQKDDRPPEEYEEPWDQKAKDIEIDLIHAKSAKDAAAAAAAAAYGSSSGGATSKENMPSANGIIGPGMGRKSEDTRPVDEYDDPWDQKMKKMNVTRTGSDSSSKSSQSPVLPSHVRSQSPKKGKSENWQNLVGERINPELPLDEQGWYHGSISRHDAEGLLRVHKEGSYLVRLSESNKLDYSLSLKSARGFMHMKITSRDGRYILGQFSQPFDSIPLMIHHYSMSKLPIKGQEHMSLMHPIIHELL